MFHLSAAPCDDSDSSALTVTSQSDFTFCCCKGAFCKMLSFFQDMIQMDTAGGDREEVKQQLNKARGSRPDMQGGMFPKSLGFFSHMHLEKTPKEGD